eukprot:992150-Prorocentrum_lima.AAC.1
MEPRGRVVVASFTATAQQVGCPSRGDFLLVEDLPGVRMPLHGVSSRELHAMMQQAPMIVMIA